MAYGPKFSKTGFKGGKNILASEHLEFVKGGATMDAGKFDKGTVDVGTLVARNTDSGKFEPFDADSEDSFDTYSITNVDFMNDSEQDMILGEVIVRGSVYEEKLADEVPDAFKDKTPMIQYINHV